MCVGLITLHGLLLLHRIAEANVQLKRVNAWAIREQQNQQKMNCVLSMVHSKKEENAETDNIYNESLLAQVFKEMGSLSFLEVYP